MVVSAGASVGWTLDSARTTLFRLDFYANDACDDSGSGEAQTPLGSVDVRTDDERARGGRHADGDAGRPGQLVTMTATRRTLSGGSFLRPGRLHETSELSPCVVAS